MAVADTVITLGTVTAEGLATQGAAAKTTRGVGATPGTLDTDAQASVIMITAGGQSHYKGWSYPQF